ncbi:hypothetical protein C2G38_2211495 [Gigaspora rosea]|uniref:Uncharacterized protein n=1 Tax=Gigaspora rosea TaxID=44941 RepID=A0A397UI98_9GLOM|nr:hypothetical protein C2G38_2211495 [Gigaspora rosea]
MLLLLSSESSDEHNTMPLLVEDDAPQNTSDKSDLKDHEDTSFNTSYELEIVPNLEDYQGALFDDAFDDLHHSKMLNSLTMHITSSWR